MINKLLNNCKLTLYILVSGKKRVNTLPGNSNWFSWEWPWDDNNTGYVQARAIPNIGEWNEFMPAKLEKLQKKLKKLHEKIFPLTNGALILFFLKAK